ncbi:MAG TPA: AAA family ATPase [Candidatus Eisenbacteria bacterium]
MPETPLGLRENPFVAGHDPRFVYSSRERQEVVARLRDGIGTGEPFLLVTGDAGIGKTSVVSEVLASCEPRALVASITNPMPTRAELLEEVCIRFGIPPEGPRTKPQALAQLERHLRDVRSRGQVAVLVADEAHRLGHDLLEEIRLLSNWEADGRKLLYVILIGLPQLEEKLARPGHEQLRQRIASHCRLSPLSAEETERYVHHRVGIVGGDSPVLFPRETCREIHRLARGVPREINRLAGRAMARAGREGVATVSPGLVRAAAAEGRRQEAVEPASHAWTTGAESSATPVTPSAGQPDLRSADPNVRAWVSRFVGPGGPPQIGVRAGAPENETFLSPSEELESEATSDAELDPEAPAPANGKKGRARGVRAHLPPGMRRRRRRRRSRARLRLALAVVAGALLATAVVLLPQTRNLASMLVGTPPIPAPALDTSTSEPAAAETQAESSAEPSAPPPDPSEAARSVGSAVATSAPMQTTASPPPQATAEPRAKGKASPPAPTERYGLEVASFINRDRAVVERQRLAKSAGLTARITNTTEDDGVVTYRIVLGSFDGVRSAERAADVLVLQGLVNEARVVSLPGRNPKSH